MSESTTVRTPKRAALAAWTGSALEYYDFTIYGTAAALVFPQVFFPTADRTTATLAAFATFGVAYIARPVGAFVLGHIGDRLGRKTVLVATLLMMGISTFAIGCLPTYDQVGALAPTLLVLLRLVQGISASGEQAGANSMSFEHAPDNRRGFVTSFTPSGTQAGQILAPAVFLPLAAFLPEEDLVSWGWRIPFLLSAVMVGIAMIIRSRLEETPEFQIKSKQPQETQRPPLSELFRYHGISVIRVFAASMFATVNTMFAVFALEFATSDDVGISRSWMLWVAIVANTVAVAMIPVWALLADRVGRKPVFLAGLAGCAVLVFPFLAAIARGDSVQVMVFGVLLAGLIYSMPNGVYPATYAEYFPTSVRLSGMAIGTQFGYALAGFMPVIAGALLAGDPTNWSRVALFSAGACLLAAIAVISGPNGTHKLPTQDVGIRPDGIKERDSVIAQSGSTN